MEMNISADSAGFQCGSLLAFNFNFDFEIWIKRESEKKLKKIHHKFFEVETLKLKENVGPKTIDAHVQHILKQKS